MHHWPYTLNPRLLISRIHARSLLKVLLDLPSARHSCKCVRVVLDSRAAATAAGAAAVSDVAAFAVAVVVDGGGSAGSGVASYGVGGGGR